MMCNNFSVRKHYRYRFIIIHLNIGILNVSEFISHKNISAVHMNSAVFISVSVTYIRNRQFSVNISSAFFNIVIFTNDDNADALLRSTILVKNSYYCRAVRCQNQLIREVYHNIVTFTNFNITVFNNNIFFIGYTHNVGFIVFIRLCTDCSVCIPC